MSGVVYIAGSSKPPAGPEKGYKHVCHPAAQTQGGFDANTKIVVDVSKKVALEAGLM